MNPIPNLHAVVYMPNHDSEPNPSEPQGSSLFGARSNSPEISEPQGSSLLGTRSNFPDTFSITMPLEEPDARGVPQLTISQLQEIVTTGVRKGLEESGLIKKSNIPSEHLDKTCCQKFQERFKVELNRYARLSHKQWGHLVGGLLGVALGVYIESYVGLQTVVSGVPLVGTAKVSSESLKLLLSALVPVLCGGLFSNLLSNLGLTLDTITHDQTLISALVDCIGAGSVATEHG